MKLIQSTSISFKGKLLGDYLILIKRSDIFNFKKKKSFHLSSCLHRSYFKFSETITNASTFNKCQFKVYYGHANLSFKSWTNCLFVMNGKVLWIILHSPWRNVKTIAFDHANIFAVYLIPDATVLTLPFQCLLQGPPGPPGLQGPVGAPGIAVSSLFRANHNVAKNHLMLQSS